MYELQSSKSLETGLFTLYIGEDNLKYYSPNNNESQKQLNIVQNSPKINGRNVKKLQALLKQKKQQKNIKNQQRTQKLNKFLINCIGNTKKSKLNHENKLENKQKILENKMEIKQQIKNKTKYFTQNCQQMTGKDHKQYYTQHPQHNKNIANSQKKQILHKKVIQIPHIHLKQDKNICQQKQNKKQLAKPIAFSTIRLKINDTNTNNSQNYKKSKSQSIDVQYKQKNKKIIRKIIQKNNKLTLEHKINFQQKKQGYKSSSNQNSKNLHIENNLSNAYPRMFKHHSEDTFKKQQLKDRQDIIAQAFLNNSCKLAQHQLQKIIKTKNKTDRLQNQLHQKSILKPILTNRQQIYNTIQYSILKLPIILKSKTKQKQNNKTQIDQNLITNKKKSNTQMYNNQNKIFVKNIHTNIIQKQEKRNIRLQLIYGTNNKKKFNLPIKIKLNQIQQEKRLSDIYYSNNQQFKAPEINIGAKMKQRIFDDFIERKRILMEKLSICTKQNNQISGVKQKNKQKTKDKSLQKNNTK